MKKIHFFAKLSGFLFVLVSGMMFLPLPDSFFCPGWVFSREVEKFGRSGRDGSNGSSGEDGRDGESRTIFVDGSELYLNLSGEDGEDGDDGDDGDDARSCRQPRRDDRDQKGADGGDGGDGGRGGNGGDGGSLTIYYTNIEDLKKIYVLAEGGRGGSGGRPGYGGDGCECRDRIWQEQVCTGTPGNTDRRCETDFFTCKDGRDGLNGSSGSYGNSGQLGRLTLIPRTELLPPEEPAIARPLSQLTNQVFLLSRHFWSTRTGATDLLGSDSMIDDEYRQFIDRIERSVKLVWNAERSPADFSDIRASLRLKDDQTVDIWVPEDLWLQTTEIQENNLTQLVVSNALLESEVTKLRLVDVAENGENLHLTLIDLGRQSDIVNTEFQLWYQTSPSAPRGRFDDNKYQTRYQGTIPPELISLNSERFTINLGQLPINRQYFRSGLNIKIELRVIRSLGDRSAEQKIAWRGSIRR
jgi:hypothetical protein